MQKNIPKKIHIIGSVGSGKTTLARKLSSKLKIPYYELDNVVWERHKEGDIRRTVQERINYLNTIFQSEKWIIEGVHNEDWVSDSFQQAEIIIYLDTKYSIRTYRIIKRFILQKLRIERSHYMPTVEIFLKMFKWNRHFEEVGRPNFFKKYKKYSDKILIVSKKKSLDQYFS
ncbi:AAA family ATPase [Bacillus sp. FJAT-49736]|uniref:AAA family ATPase n=1 Tax=Bacillus sp. FJAT-49736 TaxID=2833582 RepID=UPI001BC9A5FF|nr:AAA family ATPase [Bacillus sp. FJAT-49736]MBS4172693.1 AAA family ATPase [Bacillus sp. FJAT-49736]